MNTNRFKSTLTRLMWTAIFGVPGAVMTWRAMHQIHYDPPLMISGLVLLTLAAYSLGLTLLALLEVAFPDVKEMLYRPLDLPPVSPEEQRIKSRPLSLAIIILVSYAMALRLYIDPLLERPNNPQNPLIMILQPIYDRFGSPGLLIFWLTLGSSCLLALVWTWWRKRASEILKPSDQSGTDG